MVFTATPNTTGKMGIKSKTHFHIPYKSRWWKCAWLEQVTRVAPLAARPDKRLSIVWLAVLPICNFTFSSQQFALANFSTLKSHQYMKEQKKEQARACSFFWCRRWDLNPHGIATIGFWVRRVCHSTTSAYAIFKSFIIIKHTKKKSKRFYTLFEKILNLFSNIFIFSCDFFYFVVK